MKKGFFKRSYHAGLIIWTIVTFEILFPSLSYTLLRAIGVPINISLLVAFIMLGVLILLGLPFIPISVNLIRGDDQDFLQKFPLQIKIFVIKLLSKPNRFLRSLWVITLLVFFIGSILLLEGIAGFTNEQQFVLNGQQALATVINTDCNSEPACVPVVDFTTQNGIHIKASTACCATISICVLGRCVPKLVAIGENSVELEKGQKLFVIYNPKNPSEVQIQVQGNSNNPSAIQTVDFLTYGIIFVLIGLFGSTFIILLAIIRFIYSLLKEDIVPTLDEPKGKITTTRL